MFGYFSRQLYGINGHVHSFYPSFVKSNLDMSFFGFDPTIPRDSRHPSKAPGFGATPDPFASISQHHGLEDDNDA